MRAIVVSAAVVEQAGAFLLTRRAETTHLGGLWEFPGGKVEHGESVEDAVAREIREELGCEVVLGRALLTSRHTYEDLHVELHFFEATLVGEPAPQLGQEMRWVPRAELGALPLPEADAALVSLLTANGADGGG
jgi:8-oxo-dGTP diphosphatase